MEIGFNHRDSSKGRDIYDDCLERAGHYGVGGVSVTGVLKEINFGKGYLAVQPSIVGYGKSARLEKDRPTIITMAQGNPIVMRPLKEGDLARIVEENNKNIIPKVQKCQGFLARAKHLFLDLF